MRIIIKSLTFSALLLTSWPPYAQAAAPGSVGIEKQTVRLKRADAEEWKKEAVLHFPVFKGPADPDLRRRIQEAAGLKAGTDNSLEEWKADESSWLDEIDYEVRYNRNSILNLIYTVSGSGAYPDSFSTSLVIDLETGKRLTAVDLFNRASLEALATRLNQALNADVEATRRKWGDDWKGADEEVKNARFDVDHLDDFTIDNRGLTFHYDFGFPHVAKAMSPKGSYLLSWKELAPYIDPQGPLGIFLRP